jgi:hypothetical protein
MGGEDKGCFQRAFSVTCNKPQKAVSHKGATEKAQSPTETKLCGQFNSTDDVPGKNQGPLEGRI